MAKLYISEYTRIAYAPYQVPLMIPSEEEASYDQAPVDFSSGATASAAFKSTTQLIRLWSDTDCCICFGKSPTATVNNKPLTAKTEMFVSVKRGDKVSAVKMG